MSIYTLPDNFDIRGGRGRGSSRDREAEGRGVERLPSSRGSRVVDRRAVGGQSIEEFHDFIICQK